MTVGDWSLIEWLDAGTAPVLLVLVVAVLRLERRIFRLELHVDRQSSELEALKE